jgi:hypothetical protein
MQAWAYYEHITLPRRFVGDGRSDGVQRRAEPGENVDKTELYSPFTTRPSNFIEWGIGIDLYFSTLRFVAILMLVAGLINLPNILFFGSTSYDPDPNGEKSNLLFSLRGSAICTSYDWVVCEDGMCPAGKYENNGLLGGSAALSFRGTTTDPITGDEIVLVFRNVCHSVKLVSGMVNWITLVFLIVVFTLLSYYLRAREVRFDEDK